MKTQTAWTAECTSARNSTRNSSEHSGNNSGELAQAATRAATRAGSDLFGGHLHSSCADRTSQEDQPWMSPRTVIEQREHDCYTRLKERFARVPSSSIHTRQALYIDLWTGQHWLGVTLSYPEGSEILKPVSNDTALSLATAGQYQHLNKPLFEQSPLSRSQA